MPHLTASSLQILQKLYEGYFREVPLFKGCSSGFVKQIVSHCLPHKVDYRLQRLTNVSCLVILTLLVVENLTSVADELGFLLTSMQDMMKNWSF